MAAEFALLLRDRFAAACRSEAQLNPDEKGAILAADQPPWTAGDPAPRLLTARLA